MNNHYEIVVYWSAEDGCFLAEVPELPNLITEGATRQDALRNAEEMIDAYLETARHESWPVPKGRICELSAHVAAAILAAVLGGILPPHPPGRMPGDTAGRDACRYRQLAEAPVPEPKGRLAFA